MFRVKFILVTGKLQNKFKVINDKSYNYSTRRSDCNFKEPNIF